MIRVVHSSSSNISISAVIILTILLRGSSFAPLPSFGGRLLTSSSSHPRLFLLFGDDDDRKNIRKEGENKMEYKLELLSQKPVPDKQVEELLRNYGEKSRQYRRDVFTSADWIRSRRPDRFVDNLLTMFSSGLIRQVSFELAVLAALSAFVVLYNDLFVEGFVDFSGHKYGPILHGALPALQLPMLPFTLSTAALGLLLTFRTNVSYGRWNEARTAWGKVINDSRSIVRMGCVWARSYNNIDDAALQRLGEAVCSFSRALMNRLLSPQEDAERFRQYTFTALTDQYYGQVLRDSKHRPTAALAEITQIMVDFQLNPIHQVEVERIVTGLCDALGASERIFTSPVPTFYTRHTARFLAFWLFALPLGLYAPFGSTWNHFAMVPATVALGLFLLGIERLATEMEEPFSILPMEKMCEGSVRTPVMEQVERSMIGSYRPVTIVQAAAATSTASPPLYPAPVKVQTIEPPPPPSQPLSRPKSYAETTQSSRIPRQPYVPPLPQQQSQAQPQPAQQSFPEELSIPETMPQPMPASVLPVTQVPRSASSFTPPPQQGLSDADKRKLGKYFGGSLPYEQLIPPIAVAETTPVQQTWENTAYDNNYANSINEAAGTGTDHDPTNGIPPSAEEMNRLWASRSQSKDLSFSNGSTSTTTNGSYLDSLDGGRSPATPPQPNNGESPISYPTNNKRPYSGTGTPSYFDSFN